VIGRIVMALITKTYSKILVVLLALLGFSCASESETPKEYGMPHATFKAKGVVVSQANKVPIEGMRAVLKDKIGLAEEYEEYLRELDAVYTNSEGIFNLSGSTYAYEEKLYVKLTNVDGDGNGLFADKEIEVDYSDAKFTGASGNWNRGTAEVDLGTIEMEPKE